MSRKKRPMHCGKKMQLNGKDERGNQRFKCSVCKTKSKKALLKESEPDISTEYLQSLKEEKSVKYVITAAQNNTKIHKGFVDNLKKYCAHHDAKLIVVPIHYKNISLFTASDEYKKWWDRDIENYLVDNKLSLGGNVMIRPEKISATAVNPLSGLEGIGASSWTIYGHTQQAMNPVATPGGKKPKRMYTTGACTIKNYSRTKDGAKAEFNHVIGALVVEVYKGHAFIRQLNAHSNGNFYDLDTHYTTEKIIPNQPIVALTTGDEHVKFMAPNVKVATYTGDESIVKTLKPKFIVRHDVLDGYAGSHHHWNNDLIQFKKFHQGNNDYRRELDEVVRHINDTTPKGSTNLIVPSNHNDHLNRWLREVDPKKDPTNALIAYELLYEQYKNVLSDKTTDPLEIYISKYLKCAYKFLDRNTPFLLNGIDYSQHGDVGTNGSRGSARALSKTTYKMVIGHTHSARIEKGVYQVGKSTARLEYERGLGDHTNTHCIQYANGKRSLIDIYGNDWKAK